MFFTNVAMRYGHSAITQLVMRYEENGQVSDAGHKLIRNCMFGPNVKDLQAFGVESVVRGMAVQKEQMVDVSVIEDMRDHLVIMGLSRIYRRLMCRGDEIRVSPITIPVEKRLGFRAFSSGRRSHLTWMFREIKTALQR
ncbi:hypothetical protein BC829DRAFT_126925 [Chytridium lagenaria]|nr:hypothetical protein BC829DRAFT_126925 [Chytridium lagenaria]